MTTKIATGYIVQDNEGHAIAAIGVTQDEARENAIREVGPWEDRDGNAVGADHPEFGFDAKFIVLPATASLIAKVQADGGAIAWDVVDGIACTCDEDFAQ